jgi:hypothetical protein
MYIFKALLSATDVKVVSFEIDRENLLQKISYRENDPLQNHGDSPECSIDCT